MKCNVAVRRVYIHIFIVVAVMGTTLATLSLTIKFVTMFLKRERERENKINLFFVCLLVAQLMFISKYELKNLET